MVDLIAKNNPGLPSGQWFKYFLGFLESIERYHRVEVEGLENVPRRGSVLIAPNHPSCAGFDGALVGYSILKSKLRRPRFMTVWKPFEAFPRLLRLADQLGLIRNSFDSGVQALKRKQLLVLFPEGEWGAFKPFSERYQLQRFRSGFVRMAVLTGTPIVPCVIIGAEETHINLGQFKFGRKLKNMLLPIPLNLFPLPAKWKIKFLTPVDLSGYSKRDAHDSRKMKELAQSIQARMQSEIESEVKKRSYIYFEAPKQLPPPGSAA